MIRRFTKSRFVKNVAILSSGQTIAQVLTIAASPILTRLFEPEVFGSFGLLLAISSPLVVISGMRYELAIVPAKDDSTAANLLILSLGIVLLMSGISAAIAGFAGSFIASFVKEPAFESLLWWLPLLTLIGGTNGALRYWSIRTSRYARLATTRAVQSLATIVAQISAGLAGMGSAGLIGGRALGSVTCASILAALTWNRDRSVIVSSMKNLRIFQVAKEYSEFPKYNASQNLIGSFSTSLVPYTLAPFFGVEIVGFYYLAHRMINAPGALFATSLRRVYYQKASELHNRGKSLLRLLTLMFGGLFCIGIVPLTVILFFGPDLFSFVFGSEWHRSGIFAQWLAIWWFLAFIAAPAVETLTILKLQKFLLYFQIALSLGRFLSVLIGSLVGTDLTAIAACSIVSGAFNFGLMVFALIVVMRLRYSESQDSNGRESVLNPSDGLTTDPEIDPR